jgi:hypothetical protein
VLNRAGGRLGAAVALLARERGTAAVREREALS